MNINTCGSSRHVSISKVSPRFLELFFLEKIIILKNQICVKHHRQRKPNKNDKSKWVPAVLCGKTANDYCKKYPDQKGNDDLQVSCPQSSWLLCNIKSMCFYCTCKIVSTDVVLKKSLYSKTHTIFLDCEFFFCFFISIVADTFDSDVAMLLYS